MIIGYDPVANEVIVDLEDGTPPLSVRATTFMVKFYAQEGIHYCRLEEDGQSLEVVYMAVDGDAVVGDASVTVSRVAPGKWRTVIMPPDVA